MEYHRLKARLIATVPSNPAVVCALIGSALIALTLNGSSRHSALPTFRSSEATLVGTLNEEGKRLHSAGRYEDARLVFIRAAHEADRVGDFRAAAMNRNNAGACELVTMQFAAALKNFTEARAIAERSSQLVPLIYTLNNLASLYVSIGQPDNALRIAREALDGPAGHADEAMRAKLLMQLGSALTQKDRFDEAAVYFRESADRLTTLNQLEDAARVLGAWGNESLRGKRFGEAERALGEGLLLVRIHHVKAAANILTGLAKLQATKGHSPEAANLFASALAVTEDRTPRWKILVDRGQFLLDSGDEAGALQDFREAGRLVDNLRADMVPADQDRVAFESGIGQYLRGLVEAGNRMALKAGNRGVAAETFNAAEKDRLWSLRSLLPAANDWRSRLPVSYWETLARYQAIQRRHLGSRGVAEDPHAVTLRLQLQHLEAAAGGEFRPGDGRLSPLEHARSLLDENTVLFSFHVSAASAWVWAVDKHRTMVFALPPLQELKKTAEEVARNPASRPAARLLYTQLFGKIPATFISRSRWLLELEGPLHDIPFPALIADEKGGVPTYLAEKAVLQTIPGALLLEQRPIQAGGAFLGIADPVYNAADTRFRGEKRRPEFSLPRLPGTARELAASSGTWNAAQTQILTGTGAGTRDFWKAAQQHPSILHFAVHIVAGKGDYRSGLIALSLDTSGAMGLLGPREILARPVAADLVVMNGCHSAQGETVPNSGRMGLTRAWIGAGAASVLATQWDIADDDSTFLMTAFYRALRNAPERGVAAALREAQLAALRTHPGNVSRWAGYYVLGRAI